MFYSDGLFYNGLVFSGEWPVGLSVCRSVVNSWEIRNSKENYFFNFLSFSFNLSLSSKVYFSHSYSHYLTLSFSHNISHSILYFFLFHLSISPYTYLTLSTYVGVILSSHKFHFLILYPCLTLSKQAMEITFNFPSFFSQDGGGRRRSETRFCEISPL